MLLLLFLPSTDLRMSAYRFTLIGTVDGYHILRNTRNIHAGDDISQGAYRTTSESSKSHATIKLVQEF